MKKCTAALKKLFMALVVAVILVTGSFNATEARAAALTEEQLAEVYLNATAGILVESMTLDEFNPSGKATYKFVVDLLYSAAVLREKGGFPKATSHSYKKENEWLKDQYWSAACNRPETAQELLLGFTRSKGRNPKSSDKFVGFDWILQACTVVRCGELQDEVWQEGLDNLEREVNLRWAKLGKGKYLTRIEALDIVCCLLTPDVEINGSATSMPAPAPKPEPEPEIGSPICFIDGITYTGEPVPEP